MIKMKFSVLGHKNLRTIEFENWEQFKKFVKPSGPDDAYALLVNPEVGEAPITVSNLEFIKETADLSQYSANLRTTDFKFKGCEIMNLGVFNGPTTWIGKLQKTEDTIFHNSYLIYKNLKNSRLNNCTFNTVAISSTTKLSFKCVWDTVNCYDAEGIFCTSGVIKNSTFRTHGDSSFKFILIEDKGVADVENIDVEASEISITANRRMKEPYVNCRLVAYNKLTLDAVMLKDSYVQSKNITIYGTTYFGSFINTEFVIKGGDASIVDVHSTTSANKFSGVFRIYPQPTSLDSMLEGMSITFDTQDKQSDMLLLAEGAFASEESKSKENLKLLKATTFKGKYADDVRDQVLYTAVLEKNSLYQRAFGQLTNMKQFRENYDLEAIINAIEELHKFFKFVGVSLNKFSLRHSKEFMAEMGGKWED